MEVYAGFSENADYNVGRVIDAIDELGELGQHGDHLDLGG
jgi:arylsulfatase